MLSNTVRTLCFACGWALPAAMLAEPWPVLGCLWAALGLVASGQPWLPCRRAGLCALPALLAALSPPPRVLPALPAGPVRLRGNVGAIVRSPDLDQTEVWLGGNRTRGLRVVLAGRLQVLPGDGLRLLARVGTPPAPGLPASIHGIASTAEVAPGRWSLVRAAAAVRDQFERDLLQRVPGPAGAVLCSLVLGRSTRPESDITAAHRATGLSHLLAVSGAHAAVLAMMLGLGQGRRGRRLAQGPGRTTLMLMMLVAYAAITGGEPPVLRAVVAFALAALATATGRALPPAIGLLAPALLTAVWQPRGLLTPSFLLSYAAVLGLLLADPPAERGWRRWVLAPIAASMWATLLTAPLTLCFFGQLAPWTVVLTPLLAPLVSALLLHGLLVAIVATPLPAAADALALPLPALLDFYLAAVQWADRLPGTPVLANGQAPVWAMSLVLLAIALALWLRPTRSTVAAGAALACLPYFWLPLPAPADRCCLFAVGHGQASLIVANGRRIAIDCGSLQRPHLAAERILAAIDRRHLDLLVITHADADHHNGVPSLLQAVRVACAVLPSPLRDTPLAQSLAAAGASVSFVGSGERLRPSKWLEIAAPALPPDSSDNDQSLWVSVELAGLRLLVPGDAQELGTAAAIADGIATPHDLLVLPHHGRPNHNALRLLQRVRPRACLASAASADGDTALGPLVRRFGAELWVTGRDGNLRLSIDPPAIAGDAGPRPLPVR